MKTAQPLRILLATFILGCLPAALRAQTPTAREAVAKALPLLWEGARGHIAERDCFACHNQAVPILAFMTAGGRGFPIPEADLQEQAEFIATFLEKNQNNYKIGKGQGGQVDTAGYALWTLELAGWEHDATTSAVVEYLLLQDKDRDHWRTSSNRPPSEVSNFTASYLALRALKTWGEPSQQLRIAKRVETVGGWLRKTPARDTEDHVFRLYGLHAAGAGKKDIQDATRELLHTQRPDGGWGQTDKMESDAYATGTALTALHDAGGLAIADPPYQRGVDYLLKTQKADGSWYVQSRSKPFQTYFESGFPHGKDQFISMAATAWAATALALTCPKVTSQSSAPAPKPKVGPWDINALQSANVKPLWGEPAGKAREVYYAGEPFNGKPTRVFAYYARPATGAGPFPAVVLVHGGGGKAFRAWAEHWASRGYCALAMDLAGNGPSGRLPDGGPDQSDDVKFLKFTDNTVGDMWTYHAVAAVIRGHNLLRSLPEVDKDRIALTGISWGGYLTCIVAGLDSRLKAAVPVYGCGFLHENSAWLEPRFNRMTEEQRTQWVAAFDPSNYLGWVKCPMLFVNGTNDGAYPLDSYKKSYELAPGPKTLSVRIRLPHGHIWTFGVVDAFIDSYLNRGDPLPALGLLKRSDGEVSATVTSKVDLKEAKLNFAIASGTWQKREWQSVEAEIKNGRVVANLPTDRPLVYFLAVTDKRGLNVSTEHVVLEK